jgi:hypothetical protein
VKCCEHYQEYSIVSAIVPVASVSGVTPAFARPQAERANAPSNAPSGVIAHPVKHVEPIRYYGGIDGMNATNLIVALQSNGTASGRYAPRPAAEADVPPTIIDRGA